MSEKIDLTINISGKEEVEDIKDSLNQTTQESEKTSGSFKEMAQSSGLLSKELGIANRIKSVYTAGMAKMGITTASTTASTSGLVGMLSKLRIALIATGIGAIAVVVGTLASAFLSTQRGVDALNSVLTPLQTTLQRVWGVMQNISSFLVDGEWQNAMRELLGLRTEIQGAWRDGQNLHEIQVQLRESTIQWTTEEAKLNRTIAQNREILSDTTATLEEREQASERALQAINELEEGRRALLEQEIEAQRIIMEQNDDDVESREELARLQSELIELEIQSSNQRRAIQRRTSQLSNERERQAEEEYQRQDELLERQNRLTNALREEERLRFEQLENERLRLSRLTELRIENAEAERERRLEEAGREIEDFDQFLKEKEIIEQEHQNTLTEIEQENEEQRKQIREGELQHRREVASAIGEIFGNLSRLAGEQTAVGKALGIAQATIDTYIGANKALAQGGFLGIAQATAVIASGLANVRQIANTKVPSIQGQPVGTPASSPASFNAPDVDAQGVSTVETIFEDRATNVNVSISETEISDTQRNVREIEEQASF